MIKKISLLAAAAFVITAGCGSAPPEKKISWLEEHGDKVMIYSYSKEQLEAEIDGRWREYGYSERPVKYAAISFDDGPCGPFDNGGTASLLAKLDELNVKATFFVIGQNVRSYKTASRAIIEKGHELGNHSDGYASLGNAGEREIETSIDSASRAVYEITGKYPVFFRAPNLSHGDSLSQVCKERGMPLLDGTAHNDWPGSADAILESVLKDPKDGDIILLHENNTSKGNTQSVLPQIVKTLRERGFWITSIGRLAALKEKQLEPGVRYSSIGK